MSDRAELISSVFNKLQILRFNIEQIVAQPDKAELNESRAKNADKTLKRIEEELRKLLGLASANDIRGAIAETKRDVNGYLGAGPHESILETKG